LLHAYGLRTRPGQERLPESRVRNPCGHSINSLDSELDSGKACLQVVLPCLRAGEQVSSLPGKRRVADLPGDAQSLTTIRLGLAPLPSGESNFASQSVKPRDVFHGAGGSGLDEASLYLGQRPVRVAQSQEGICDTGAQVYGPAPPVPPEALLDAVERVFQQGEGLLRFTQMQIVKPQVD
jgi:hypothetical protein